MKPPSSLISPKIGVLSILCGCDTIAFGGVTWAAPVDSSVGTTTTPMITTDNPAGEPLTTTPGLCGTASLTMFNGGSRTKIDAHWKLVSSQGNIVYEDVEVALDNGDSLGYDGPGPVVLNVAAGQVTFAGWTPGTLYQGTLTRVPSHWIPIESVPSCQPRLELKRYQTRS